MRESKPRSEVGTFHSSENAAFNDPRLRKDHCAIDVYIIDRHSIAIQPNSREPVKADRQVFIVGIEPIVNEFDGALGMLWLCGWQVDGHPAMADAPAERPDAARRAVFRVDRHAMLVSPKPQHRPP